MKVILNKRIAVLALITALLVTNGAGAVVKQGQIVDNGRRLLAGARVVMTGQVVETAPATISVVDTKGQTLNGVVVAVGNQRVTTDESGRATFNVEPSDVDRKSGKPVLTAAIVGAGAITTALVLPSSIPGNVPTSIQHVPAVVTQGSELPIGGTGIDPHASGNTVVIDGRGLPVLAASPVELKAAVTSDLTPGPHNVKVINSNGAAEATTNIARVDLTASQSTITTGGGAEVQATASGLKGAPRSAFPMTLTLTNQSQRTIAFEDSSSATFTHTINYEEVTPDGQFSIPLGIRALAPGEFQITATLESCGPPVLISDQDDCSKLLDEANKKRQEANNKRAEADGLDTDASVLEDPGYWKGRAASLRSSAANKRQAAAEKRKIKNPVAHTKESYEKEAKALEGSAAKDDAAAAEIEGRIEKYKNVKGKDREQMAKNKRQQAKNLRKQAETLEKDAEKLEKEAAKKCKN